MNNIPSLRWLILLCIGWSGYHVYLTEDSFTKFSKIDRIASSAAQELLYYQDPALGRIISPPLDIQPASFSNAMSWEHVAIGNDAGRIRCLSTFTKDDQQYIFAGSASGGLWMSRSTVVDEVFWQKSSLPENTISSIYFDSSDSILYVGTGEGYFQNDAFPGSGVYTSADFGHTWERSDDTADFAYVQSIVKQDEGIVVSSLHDGIFLSSDHGSTYAQSDNASFSSVNDLLPLSNNSLLVSSGLHSQGRIMHLNLLDKTANEVSYFKQFEHLRRIELAQSPSNQAILYALAEDINTENVRLFKSTDEGTNWQELPLNIPFFAGGQAWYNLVIEVSPLHPDNILIGGLDLHASLDGGMTWHTVTQHDKTKQHYVHADQHAIHFLNENDVLVGNDGGVALIKNVFDVGSLTVTTLNDGLHITQCNSGLISQTDSTLYLGTQDNGVLSSNLGSAFTQQLLEGDAGSVIVDEDDPSLIISSYIKNNYFISRDGGKHFYYRDFSNNGLFANPVDYDHSRNILYAVESPGKLLRWNNPADLGRQFDIVNVTNISEQITTVHVGKNMQDRLYIGTANGGIYYLDFCYVGKHRYAFHRYSFGEGNVVKKVISFEEKPQELLALVSNAGVNNIYTSTNQGKSWIAHDGDLPNIAVRDILIREDGYYLGTDYGIWYTDQLHGVQTHWKPLRSPFTMTPVNQLLNDAQGNLLAITYGNGVFRGKEGQAFDLRSDQAALTIGEERLSSWNCGDKHQIQSIVGSISGCVDDVTLDAFLLTDDQTQHDISIHSVDLSTDGSNFRIDIEVIDDTTPEPEEAVILVVEARCLGSTKQLEIPIQIIDNDNPLLEDVNSSQVSIGELDEQTAEYPFKAYYEDEKMELLVKAEELLSKGMAAGNIQKLELYVLKKLSGVSFNDFTITMSSDKNNQISDFTSGQVVFQNKIDTKEGWNTFNLQEPFYWNGSDNIRIQMCFNNNIWSNSDVIACHKTDFPSVVYSYKDSNVGCTLSYAEHSSDLRPTIRMYSGSRAERASEATSDYSIELSGNAESILRDDQNDVVVVIQSNGQNSCEEVRVFDEIAVVNEMDVFHWTFHTKMVSISNESQISTEYRLFYNTSEFQLIDESKSLKHIILVDGDIYSERSITLEELTQLNAGVYSLEVEMDRDFETLLIQESSIDYRQKDDDEEVEVRMVLSPNPFSSAFRVEYDLPQEITITDVLLISPKGERLGLQTEFPDSKSIHVFPDSGLQSGWYFVKVILSNGEYNMLKAIKQ